MSIISILTITFSWLIKLVGFPHQIRKMIKAKSSENVSLLLVCLTFISFILWTIYGIIKNDYVIVYGQGIGVISSGVTIYYLIKFRHK